MIIKLLNPDNQYARLLAEHGNYEKIVKFFRKEAEHLIKLKQLIDICATTKDYNYLLPKMVEASEHIRTKVLKFLKHQFYFFEFRQKWVLEKFLHDLNR